MHKFAKLPANVAITISGQNVCPLPRIPPVNRPVTRNPQPKAKNRHSTKDTPRKRTPKPKRASSSRLRTPAINLSTGNQEKAKTGENTREGGGKRV